MRKYYLVFIMILIQLCGVHTMAFGKVFVAADHPSIQYYGRWDKTDLLHPKFSWPGVYLCAEFSGTSIGILLRDSTNYYNVYIDGALHSRLQIAKYIHEENS
jgi:hypothetical protein